MEKDSGFLYEYIKIVLEDFVEKSQQSFSFDTFNSLKLFKKLEYADSFFKVLGEGSSRRV